MNKEEIVFIDDHPDTIEKYSKLGIKCIHFTKEIDLEQELRNLGVEI